MISTVWTIDSAKERTDFPLSLLKKINKGAILAVLILLVLAVYHTTLAIIHAEETKAIKLLLNDYYNWQASAVVFDSQYHELKNEVPKEAQDKKLDAEWPGVEKLFVKDAKYLVGLKDQYKSSLSMQGQDYYQRNRSRKLTELKIKRTLFEKDQITVTVTAKFKGDSEMVIDFYGKSSAENLSTELRSIDSESSDTFIIKKVGEDYKIFSGGEGAFNERYEYNNGAVVTYAY